MMMPVYINIAQAVYWLWLLVLLEPVPCLGEPASAHQPPLAVVSDDDRIILDATAAEARQSGMELAREAVRTLRAGRTERSHAAARAAVFQLGVAYALEQDRQEPLLAEILRMYCLLGQDDDLLSLYVPRALPTRTASPGQSRLLLETARASAPLCSEAQLRLLQEATQSPQQLAKRAHANIVNKYRQRAAILNQKPDKNEQEKLAIIELSVATYVFHHDKATLQTICLFFGKLPPLDVVAQALSFHIRVAQEPRHPSLTRHEQADFVQRLEYLRAVHREALATRPPQVEVQVGGMVIRRDFSERGQCYQRQMTRYVLGPASCFGDPSVTTGGGQVTLWGYPLIRSREVLLRGLGLGVTADYWSFRSRSVDPVREQSTYEALGHGLRLAFDLRWKFRVARSPRLPLPLVAAGYEWLATYYQQQGASSEDLHGRLSSSYHSITIGGGMELPYLSRRVYRLFADLDVRYKRSFQAGDLDSATVGHGTIDAINGIHVFAAPLAVIARTRKLLLTGGVKTYFDFHYLSFHAAMVTAADPWPPQAVTAARNSKYAVQGAWDRYLCGVLYFGLGY